MGRNPNKQVQELARLIRVDRRTIYRWLQVTTIDALLTQLKQLGPLIKPSEVALQIGVSTPTIYRWASGYSTVVLPCCFFPGETVRFERQKIEEFIKRRR